MRFETFVQCRLGEPITAVALDREELYFGSISGYIGRYSSRTRAVEYYSNCHPELIRDIHVHENELYACVGDEFIACHNINDLSSYHILHYEGFMHKDLLCGNYFSLINFGKQSQSVVALLALFPTTDTERLSTINSSGKHKQHEARHYNEEAGS
jgi:hypothetical protein